MPVKLNGSTSGSVTIDVPAVAGTNTLTLPAVTDTLVGLAATQTLTGKTLTSPTITGAIISSMASSVLTSATAQASTSGTSIDFTGIPSYVKRITVMFSGVSTSGTSNLLIQLGTSGGVVSTGYVSGAWTSNANNVSSTAGVIITGVNTAAGTHYGVALVCNFSGNAWVTNYAGGWGSGSADVGGGAISLSGALDRVRITTVNGTDTFDAGSINIMYE